LRVAELEKEIATDDHMAGLARLIRSGHDLVGATRQWEEHYRRLRQPVQRTAAQAATHARILKSATKQQRKAAPSFTAALLVESAELVAARRAVAEATAGVADEQAKLAKFEADAAAIDYGSSGAKGRLSQAVRDISLQRELASLAAKHLEKLRADLAEAERIEAGSVQQHQLKQLRVAAERYIALCSDVDSAIAVLANAIGALGPVTAELESLRKISPASFTPNLYNGGRNSHLLTAAIGACGEEARRFFDADLLPPSRRRSLEENAKRGLAPIFAQASGDKE
jgi:hypothetical protein